MIATTPREDTGLPLSMMWNDVECLVGEADVPRQLRFVLVTVEDFPRVIAECYPIFNHLCPFLLLVVLLELLFHVLSL